MSAAELERLHREFNPILLRRLLRVGAWPADAEEAAAEAWRILWQNGCSLDNPMGWLTVVARHELFRLWRNRSGERLTDRPFEPGRSCDDDCHHEALDLLRAIAQLKPQQRYVLSRRLAGLSYAEAQAESGATHTWVNRHLTEGRSALRERLA